MYVNHYYAIGAKGIGISGSLIWLKTLMELIFNTCGEFRWSPDGPVNQIHSPHLDDGAPGIFSDLLRFVQLLKREWGAESDGKLPQLFIPRKRPTWVPKFAVGRTAALTLEFAMKYLPLGRTHWCWLCHRSLRFVRIKMWAPKCIGTVDILWCFYNLKKCYPSSINNKNHIRRIQLRSTKTDWSGLCQMAVQGTMWLANRYPDFATSHMKLSPICLHEAGWTLFQILYSRKVSRVWPGIEPGTSGIIVRHTNHYTATVSIIIPFPKHFMYELLTFCNLLW